MSVEVGTAMRGTYYRWSQTGDSTVRADILGSRFGIVADPETGATTLTINNEGALARVALDPDEARMIGVRLIEGAAIADASRSVRAII